MGEQRTQPETTYYPRGLMGRSDATPVTKQSPEGVVGGGPRTALALIIHRKALGLDSLFFGPGGAMDAETEFK